MPAPFRWGGKFSLHWGAEMSLNPLQQAIIAVIAANRSDTSYLAGGVVLNRDWPRETEDIDIFQDTDEEITEVAKRDIEILASEGFSVAIEIIIYGCVEAVISRDGESTMIQWMSENRKRFLPLIRDSQWGARLHQADLAVNKVLAASTRRKARDYVDLILIEERFCPLGPLFMAASGKPPHYSPMRIVEEIRHKGLSIETADFNSVRGLPPDHDAAAIRGKLEQALARAEDYIMTAPPDLVGLLTVDAEGKPIEVSGELSGYETRRATSDPQPLPSFADEDPDWRKGGP